MARVNVYLPDDLADEIRLSGLNVSAVGQEAIRAALAARRPDARLKAAARFDTTGIPNERVRASLSEVRSELWGENAGAAGGGRIRERRTLRRIETGERPGTSGHPGYWTD